MLQLKNISKQYKTGELIQKALDGVSISLRDCEFVSILGPSGSGKTTLLNIIGGLDRYDSGDLCINGRSTKEYGDRDWDTYRNHSIGFVFQSYNLIPHQTILSNVELALTIAGVSRGERKRRAKEALAEVGLAGQEHKRPNQMSGGQMQRVAIARALVNNPDILLADEPTGALDTETSVQVMELLRKVAKKRLVVMVTHNPELAEAYSTRIVKLRDGKITDDSAPYNPETVVADTNKKEKKARMSFFTSLALSAQNLRTKKGRTILTAFAGSIGIIGIALILALSSGVNRYIADIQKDTMTSYPITISAKTFDLSAIMGQNYMAERRNNSAENVTHDKIFADFRAIEATNVMKSSIAENDLTAFKKYIDDPNSEIRQYIGENGVVYTYDVEFEVFTEDPLGNVINTNASVDDISEDTSSSRFKSMMNANMSGMSFMLSNNGNSGADNFSELTVGNNGNAVSRVVTDNYELAYGRWPEKYDELVLFLNDRNALSAESLYQLGFLTADEYKEAENAIKSGEKAKETSFDYSTATGKIYKLVPACDRYIKKDDGTFRTYGETASELNEILDNALELKIVGVVYPVAKSSNLSVSTAIGYTSLLRDYVIKHTNESAVVLAQEADKEFNILTGMHFSGETDEEKMEDAKKYISALGVTEKARLFSMIMYYSSENMASEGMSGAAVSTDMADMSGAAGMPDMSGVTGMEGMAGAAGMDAMAGMGGITGMTGMAAAELDESTLSMLLDKWLEDTPDPEILLYFYDTYVSGTTYSANMESFGKVSYDAPSSISIYTDSFEDKDLVADSIAHYNDSVEESKQITYTDYVALITSSITNIVDVISYVLIAFVSVSLVVSCIMIGIITHISVLERTKEIGILRALGASKRNISQVFNAETVIIGFCAGVLGVGISMLLTIPINAILRSLTGSENVDASLPVHYGLILIAISVVITVIGGLIPARKAAKKEPVTALRTE
ncbi:MAG: ABC transporter ATP-binding protein/permease [Lachnospiraceae bacterium]|nr:ABC transporter ATP-binding protein/permease [Lachnospiraceae bacterium]